MPGVHRRARGRGDAHPPAALLQRHRRRLLVQHGAGAGRRTRQAEGVVQRVHVAAAPVDEAAVVGRVDQRPGGGRIQERGVAVAHHLFQAADLGLEVRQVAGLDRAQQVAGQLEVAVDGVLGDQAGDEIARFLRHVEQGLGPLGPQHRHQLGRALAQTGDDLAAVAARRAPADAAAFQQHDREAGLRRVQRRRQPGRAAADHHQVGPGLAGQRRAGAMRARRGRIVGPGHVQPGVEAHLRP